MSNSTPNEDRFSPIEDVVAAIGRGEMVVMVDDEDRENEGDLIMAA
ncbi:MAG: 3,4-dihydroxy-2-butanone-4-phosphate synthase, partial [Ilumatobacteraceae bacterium]